MSNSLEVEVNFRLIPDYLLMKVVVRGLLPSWVTLGADLCPKESGMLSSEASRKELAQLYWISEMGHTILIHI